MGKFRLHFILEGNVEEEALFKLIDDYGSNDEIIVSHENCGGVGRIPIYYQNELPLDNYDLIYCVYDVDNKSSDEDSQFCITRKKLTKVLGREELVDKISLCTNPNILLILLLGYDDADKFKDLKVKKKDNTEIIKKYCPKIGNKQDYDGHQWQVNLITDGYMDGRASYDRIIQNSSKISKNYMEERIASNIIVVMKAIKQGDVEYFKRIMKNINGDSKQ